MRREPGVELPPLTKDPITKVQRGWPFGRAIVYEQSRSNLHVGAVR